MAGRWNLRVGLCVVVLLWACAATASAEPPDGWGGKTGDSRVRVDLYRSDLETLTATTLASEGSGPWYEYELASVCGVPLPGDPDADILCGASYSPCSSTNPHIGEGPALRVFRREVNRHGVPVTKAWTPIGVTCLPQYVPGGRASLSLAVIEKAFHETEFAVPVVNVQPEGDVTLVNLPTYFEVRFPEAGFGPDEVDRPDPGRLLGYAIEVRPRPKEVTYHLGERTLGPTRDLGGPYPSGTVVHSYARPGEHRVRVDVVYTGQFRVGGSGWIDIPGEVIVRGTPTTLTVREARSRLNTS